MKCKVIVCICMFISFFAISHATAEWYPEDGHKMHFPQLPDTTGWDVDAYMDETILADDWMCSASGPISEIYFWGSWFNGETGAIDSFKIQILADIPADPPSLPYSRPGAVLWEITLESWQLEMYSHWASTMEGYYLPGMGAFYDNNHNEYWSYSVNLLDWLIEDELFVQYEGTVYWLSIQAFVNPYSSGGLWGWKTTQDRWNDCAVYRNYWVEWTNMFEPPAFIDSLNLAFVINGEPQYAACCQDDGVNVFCTEETQYDCENIIGGTYLGYGIHCSGWIGACCLPDGSCVNADSICCTESLGGTFNGQTVCSNDMGACCFPDGSCANMEFVCCETAGGTFYYQESCLGDNNGDGSDDLCVEPVEEGACCFSDGSCLTITEADCINQGGSYEGDGTQCAGNMQACCLPDGECMVADAFCCVEEFGGTPLIDETCGVPGACCLPDHTCVFAYEFCCYYLLDGYFDEYGECGEVGACCVNGECMMVDETCCTYQLQGTWIGGTCSEPQACCLPDGSCQEMDPACCSGWQYNGTPQGEGSSCLGDGNGNQIDDACEEPVQCSGKCGDANNDNSVNVSDAVYIINYVFASGALPLPVLACGDANGDGSINVSDAVFIINYVFVGGGSPGDCSPGDPDWNGEDCCEF